MGSKLRKLRAQAGVAGRAHQAMERAKARNRELADRAALTKLNSCSSCGSAVKDPRKQLCDGCALRLAASSTRLRPFVAEAIDRKVEFEERRIKVGHLLGSHEGAAELADAIQRAAIARAQQTTARNADVIDVLWGEALAELGRGVAPDQLSVLRPVVEVARPPAAGMRLARRMPLLLQAALVTTLLGMNALPKEEP